MRASKFYYLLLVAPVTSASTSGDHLNFDISASSQLTDNAEKQYVESIKIEERQDLYQLGLDTAYKNDWLGLKARYGLAEQQYTKNSQPDYTSLVGDLQLDVGSNYQLAHLKVLQSSVTLLNAPDAVDISSNRDQRSILTAEPSLRWRATDANILVASLRLSEVDYDKQTAKNSTTESAQLAWEHEVSKVDKVTLSVVSSKTSFDADKSLDYSLDSVLAGYSVALNHLDYEISMGANRVIQEVRNIDFSRPNFDVSVKYTSGLNIFNLNVSRKISDSSSGGGALSGLAASGSTERGAAGLDLIDLAVASINWTTNAICDRCVANLSFTKSNENYEVLLEDSIVNSVRATFSYRVARNSNLTFSYWQQKRNFDANVLRINTADKNYEIRYSYTFVNGISLDAFANKYARDSLDKFASYDENLSGIKLAYAF